MKKISSLIILAVLAVSVLLSGCKDSKIPAYKGYVNDFAGMIPGKEEESLESLLVNYEKQTTNEIAVVTVESIGSESVEDYTMRLAEKWKVGKADKDNGVIILVAEEEKKIRIEVGYGLEPVLTDTKAKLIIDREMTPRFKQGNYADGVTAGASAVIAVLNGSYNPSAGGQTGGGGLSALTILVLIILGVIVLAVIIAALSGDAGGGSWSSGGGFSSGGGGGGGGFGGGGFGGGGASGGW